MKNVYVTFDTEFRTWNVVDEASLECLAYGSTGDCDEFLFFNPQYNEVK